MIIGDVRPGAVANDPTAADATGDDPLVAMFGHFPSIAEIEEYMIDQALKMTKGNQGMAANLLGIGRQTLNKRLNKKQ